MTIWICESFILYPFNRQLRVKIIININLCVFSLNEISEFAAQECRTVPNGKDYAGSLAKTSSGKTCTAWALSNEYVTSREFPEGNAQDARNKCRNPAWNRNFAPYGFGVWCLTTDQNVPWESCNVPMCGRQSICRPSIAM